MQRLPDWSQRLHTLLLERANTPFAWGSHDCCLFPCDCILAMTGFDPAASFRGKYKSKRDAYCALRRFAGGGLEAVIEKIAENLSVREIAPHFATSGDLVLHETPEGHALGVCLGASLATAGTDGVIARPVTFILRAWKV